MSNVKFKPSVILHILAIPEYLCTSSLQFTTHVSALCSCSLIQGATVGNSLEIRHFHMQILSTLLCLYPDARRKLGRRSGTEGCQPASSRKL